MGPPGVNSMSGLCSRHASLYDVRSPTWWLPNAEYLTQTETQTKMLRKLAAGRGVEAEGGWGAGKDVQ